MTSVVGTQALHNTTQPYYSLNDVPEWERLDEMHRGIDAYLGHKLSSSPAVQNVKKVLEIGCGSGAWAIQAAQTYPEAIVTAIDVSPLPPRPLPSNMQFLHLDIMEPLPFEPESFDIIHARFVFVHLPNWKQVIENVISLLKPQGWLWIEDVDLYFYDDGLQGLGSSLKLFNDLYLSFSSSRNVDPFFGTSLEPVLKELGSFLEVNHVEIKCATNGRDSGTSHQSIGQVIWASLRRSLTSSKLMYNAVGMTSELKEGVYREAEDPLRSVYLKLHMTWSQKK